MTRPCRCDHGSDGVSCGWSSWIIHTKRWINKCNLLRSAAKEKAGPCKRKFRGLHGMDDTHHFRPDVCAIFNVDKVGDCALLLNKSNCCREIFFWTYFFLIGNKNPVSHLVECMHRLCSEKKISKRWAVAMAMPLHHPSSKMLHL
jgi:hypothetical protein